MLWADPGIFFLTFSKISHLSWTDIYDPMSDVVNLYVVSQGHWWSYVVSECPSNVFLLMIVNKSQDKAKTNKVPYVISKQASVCYLSTVVHVGYTDIHCCPN